MAAKPMAQLINDIRSANPAPSTGSSMSQPIPLLDGDRLLIAVFHYGSGYDLGGRTNLLEAPTLVSFFDAATGARVREDKRPGGTSLGAETFDVPRSEMRALLDDFYGASDALLPAFARHESKPSPEIKAAARKYKGAFSRLSGKLLLPYYQEVGRAWFAWVDRVAA